MNISLFTKHPFTVRFNEKEEEISLSQKRILIITSIVSLLLVGIGAPIAFLGLSYYFRFRKITKLQEECQSDRANLKIIEQKPNNLEITKAPFLKESLQEADKTSSDAEQIVEINQDPFPLIKTFQIQENRPTELSNLSLMNFTQICTILEKSIEGASIHAVLDKFNEWLSIHSSINTVAYSAFLKNLAGKCSDENFAYILGRLSLTSFTVAQPSTLQGSSVKAMFNGFFDKGPITRAVFLDRLDDFALNKVPLFKEELLKRAALLNQE